MRPTVVLVATVALATSVAAPAAHAQCPRDDGTVPGSSTSVTTIGPDDGVAFNTYFVDDRDRLNLDGDADAGGLWLYTEHNATPGLTRGAPRAMTALPLPWSGPIYVVPPDPDRPVVPQGVWFQSALVDAVRAELSAADDCTEAGAPGGPATSDLLIF